MYKASYKCMKCRSKISNDLIFHFDFPFHSNCIANQSYVFRFEKLIKLFLTNCFQMKLTSEDFLQKRSFIIEIEYTFDKKIDFLEILFHFINSKTGIALSQKNQNLVISINNIQLPNCLLSDYIKQITNEIISISSQNTGRLVKEPLITINCLGKEDPRPFFFFDIIYEKITKDFYSNYFELKIIKGDAVYNHKNEYVYHQSRNNLSSDEIEECLLYHGVSTSNDSNSSLLKQSDKFLFKGYYLTNNIFFGSFSGKDNFSPLKIGEEATVIMCKVFYNKKYKQNMLPLPDLSPKSILQNKGVITTYIGDQHQNYLPIEKESSLRINVFAQEYIFNNSTQIVPIYKLKIIRKDYCILIKSNHISTEIIQKISQRFQVNVYICKTDIEAIKLIRRKKANRIKLVINEASELIQQAREIIQSNFLCLIHATTLNDMQQVKKIENVLITDSDDMLRKYLSLEMNEEETIKFIGELEQHLNETFNINREEILKFPLFIKDLPYNPSQTIHNMDKVMV